MYTFQKWTNMCSIGTSHLSLQYRAPFQLGALVRGSPITCHLCLSPRATEMQMCIEFPLYRNNPGCHPRFSWSFLATQSSSCLRSLPSPVHGVEKSQQPHLPSGRGGMWQSTGGSDEYLEAIPLKTTTLTDTGSPVRTTTWAKLEPYRRLQSRNHSLTLDTYVHMDPNPREVKKWDSAGVAAQK